MNQERPIEIHPQRCYGCGIKLREGDAAFASRNFPIVFCAKCHKASAELVPAVVKTESSG